MSLKKAIALSFGYCVHSLLCGLLFRFLPPTPTFILTAVIFGVAGSKVDRTNIGEFLAGTAVYAIFACFCLYTMLAGISMKPHPFSVVVFFALLPAFQALFFAVGYMAYHGWDRMRHRLSKPQIL